MILALLVLAEQPAKKTDWFDGLGETVQQSAPEKLGPGPHTLVITDGSAVTRIDYKTGAACTTARDAVRYQTDARLSRPPTPGIIYGAPRVQAFCVPR